MSDAYDAGQQRTARAMSQRVRELEVGVARNGMDIRELATRLKLELRAVAEVVAKIEVCLDRLVYATDDLDARLSAVERKPEPEPTPPDRSGLTHAAYEAFLDARNEAADAGEPIDEWNIAGVRAVLDAVLEP